MKSVIVKILFMTCLYTVVFATHAADIAKGSAVYANNCQICHADDGSGVTPDAPDFRFGDSLIKPDKQLFSTISSGVGMMPAFRGVLSEQDILDVIAYLRTLN